MIDLSKFREKRVIDVLRERYPGRWRYEHPVRWVHEDGWYVEARSLLAPQYDGDDETCVTRYYAVDRPGAAARVEIVWLV